MKLFDGVRPLTRRTAARDGMAGLNIAAMSIPQVLGYARIAGMPLATGLHTALIRRSYSPYSGRRAIWWWPPTPRRRRSWPDPLRRWRRREVRSTSSLVTTVALLTAGLLLLARIFKLGFLADFLSRTVLVGFLAGVGVQVGVAVAGDMLGVATPARSTLGQAWQILHRLAGVSVPSLIISVLVIAGILIGKQWAPRAPLALLLASPQGSPVYA